MKKTYCCEFAKLEAEKDRSELLGKMYRQACEQILKGEELWLHNSKAVVRYSVCNHCKIRITFHFSRCIRKAGINGALAGKNLALALNRIEHKLKPWYPKFLVRWMIEREVKRNG